MSNSKPASDHLARSPRPIPYDLRSTLYEFIRIEWGPHPYRCSHQDLNGPGVSTYTHTGLPVLYPDTIPRQDLPKGHVLHGPPLQRLLLTRFKAHRA